MTVLSHFGLIKEVQVNFYESDLTFQYSSQTIPFVSTQVLYLQFKTHFNEQKIVEFV